MLAVLRENAERLGLDQVSAFQADSESLPFADESFDLVLGHAVLHHLPNLDRAFAEFLRVLRPGGRILFAGEPSRAGDRLARVPKRAALLAAPLWRRVVGAGEVPSGQSPEEPDGDGAHDQDAYSVQDQEAYSVQDPADYSVHDLEGQVDIHAFRPEDLRAVALSAGFTGVSVRGEELLANWFGWFNRGLEATAKTDEIPSWWRSYAFRGYLWLQRLDAAALEPHLPAAIFYNLLLTATRPGAQTTT
jgi:SAM-dependent methyltransferase